MTTIESSHFGLINDPDRKPEVEPDRTPVKDETEDLLSPYEIQKTDLDLYVLERITPVEIPED